MSVLTALYKSYEYCEENGFVDRSEKIDFETVLLPIYHSNKESRDEDIIEVTLDKNAEIIFADYLEKNKKIIFPVTEDSISRSSGIAPHPLAEEVSYFVEKNKNEEYIKNLDKWINFSKENNQKSYSFLKIIKNFLNQKKFLEEIFKKCYKDRFCSFSIIEERKSKGKTDLIIEVKYLDNNEKKKIKNVNKIFITFKIQNLFDDLKDYSITNYKQLHKDYIKYTNNANEKYPKKLCNISGKKIYCSSKHRGLFGNSKLISVSNHSETYFGRLKKGEEIISIGYETSQKIHNMIKYLLENKKSSISLGENSYLVNWFSDDINNFENISVTRDASDYLDIFDQEIFEEKIDMADMYNENIIKYLSGNHEKINSKSQYYIMIVNKISNGRVSIKYFRELPKSEFYERVSRWYDTISWIKYNYKEKKKWKKYPGIYKIIDYTYGIEKKDGKIEFDQKEYKRDLMESLITTMIDGKKIPLNIVKKMYFNVSNRQKYDQKWNLIVDMACSIFKKYNIDYKNKEVNEKMFDNNDRDFLYGRLLAIFEKMEAATFDDEKRTTNAQRLWSAYVNNPGKTMNILFDKLQPYKRKLENSKRGLYVTFEKKTQEIMENLMKTDNFENNKNKKLKENFIFGYYYQLNEIFKSKKDED